MAYFICFISSALFLGIAEKGRHKWIKKIVTVIALALPCILAALRDTSVGSDVEYYVVPFFNRAVAAYHFHDYLVTTGLTTSDYGYSALNFIISRFTSEIGWLLFLTETIIIVFVYFACKNLNTWIPTWKSMLIFYFLFYNMTLSTVRQSCACAIVFFCITYCMCHEYDRKCLPITALLIALAFSFHKTALFGIVILFMLRRMYRGQLNTKKKMYGLMIVVAVVFLTFKNALLSLLYTFVSLFASKYSNDFFFEERAGASGYTVTIIMAIIIVLTQLYTRKISNNSHLKETVYEKWAEGFLTLNVVYLIAMLGFSQLAFVPRMMYYIQIMWCAPFARTGNIVTKDTSNQVAMAIITFSICALYWWYFYIFAGVHGTYPYILR